MADKKDGGMGLGFFESFQQLVGGGIVKTFGQPNEEHFIPAAVGFEAQQIPHALGFFDRNLNHFLARIERINPRSY